MPTLRIMQDGRPIYATPGGPDALGVPSFMVGGGNTELLRLDFTAWLGSGVTLAASTWTVSGGSLGTETNSGGEATVLVTLPQQPAVSIDVACVTVPAVTLAHVAQASDGRALRQMVRLYPQPSTVDSSIIFDQAILG